MPETERGKHKIFLGYAPGVGKTFAMLDEGLRRKSRGQDVVVGVVETRGRQALEDQLSSFECVPTLEGPGLPAMDLHAIIQRKPDAVLVDPLYAADGQRARWVEVERLLDAGINVISTMDVRHVESLNDKIREITGLKVEDTVPDRVLREAEEIEMVDVTPTALINRLNRGDVTLDATRSTKHLKWFEEGALSALRELALREVAGRVDQDVQEYMKRSRVERPWATQDRVMICLSPTRSSLRLVRKGWRLAQRVHADAVVVFVEEKAADEATRKLIRDDFTLAERLGMPTKTLHGDAADEIVRFAKENSITQLVIGHSTKSGIGAVLKGSIINDLVRQLASIDIMVVALDANKG